MRGNVTTTSVMYWRQSISSTISRVETTKIPLRRPHENNNNNYYFNGRRWDNTAEVAALRGPVRSILGSLGVDEWWRFVIVCDRFLKVRVVLDRVVDLLGRLNDRVWYHVTERRRIRACDRSGELKIRFRFARKTFEAVGLDPGRRDRNVQKPSGNHDACDKVREHYVEYDNNKKRKISLRSAHTTVTWTTIAAASWKVNKKKKKDVSSKSRTLDLREMQNFYGVLVAAEDGVCAEKSSVNNVIILFLRRSARITVTVVASAATRSLVRHFSGTNSTRGGMTPQHYSVRSESGLFSSKKKSLRLARQ